MKSRIIDATLKPMDSRALFEAADLLKNDQVVAIPTETVYGLAANALSPGGVKKIFEAKCRPMDNPVIVHISSRDMLDSLIEKPLDFSLFEKLISIFWPGALTFIFPKSLLIPDTVTAGLPTVAIRYPSHPIALSLIEQCGFPLAAPSANISGRPSPTKAQHVVDDLGDKIPLIIDGGSCINGLESTVINLLSDPPMILRPGSITFEMLKPHVPNLHVYRPSKQIELDPLNMVPANSDSNIPPLSPGMKYRHYSPKARFYLLEHAAFEDNQLLDLIPQLDSLCQDKKLLGSILIDPSIITTPIPVSSSFIVETFSEPAYHTIASELFSKLRRLDSLNVDFILMLSVDEADEGSAIMNRILKASNSVLSSEAQVLSLFDN